MTRELHKRGYIVNYKRVLRLMGEHGFLLRRKRFNPITTDSRHRNSFYPNLILGMKASRPNEIWAADFTDIQLNAQYVYLGVVLDQYGRRIIGWSLSRSLDTPLLMRSREPCTCEETMI